MTWPDWCAVGFWLIVGAGLMIGGLRAQRAALVALNEACEARRDAHEAYEEAVKLMGRARAIHDAGIAEHNSAVALVQEWTVEAQ